MNFSAPVAPMTRREMRAAGLYDLASDAAAPDAPRASMPVPPAPAAWTTVPPTPVPLVEPAAVVAHPVTESTLAMQVTEIETELAATVPPLAVHQAPITAIVPMAREAERLDVASIFGLAASTDVPVSVDVDAAAGAAGAVTITSRRGKRLAAAAAASAARRGRQPREKRATRAARTAPRTAATAAAPPATRPARQPAAVRAASDRKSIRQRATGFGVMVLVGGLFAVLALPAYADNNASSLTAASAVRTQKLTVNEVAAADSTKVSRDGYTATSASDLKTLYASAIRQQNLAAYMQSGAKAQGDDYPWFAELSRNQGGGLSPLNYYYRECVDFVAWRLNRDAGATKAPFKWVWSNLTPSGGNASQWKSAWLNHGWATGTTPVVGSVAWFPYNHVAYVSGILNDGSVALEEYNWQGEHLYSTRIIQPGDAYYLYAPPA